MPDVIDIRACRACGLRFKLTEECVCPRCGKVVFQPRITKIAQSSTYVVYGITGIPKLTEEKDPMADDKPSSPTPTQENPNQLFKGGQAPKGPGGPPREKR